MISIFGDQQKLPMDIFKRKAKKYQFDIEGHHEQEGRGSARIEMKVEKEICRKQSWTESNIYRHHFQNS